MARPVDPSQTTIPNCIEIVLDWSTTDRGWTNVLHGQYPTAGDPTQTLVDALFSGFKAALTSSGWGALLHTDVSFNGVRAKDMKAPNRAFVTSTGTAATGTGTGTIGPLQNAIVVTLNTAQSGRGYRGRVFLAGMDSTAMLSHTHATQAADTAAAAFLEAIRQSTITNSVPLSVAQRALLPGTSAGGAAMGPRPAGNPLVTACRISNSRVDTQRRRLGR